MAKYSFSNPTWATAPVADTFTMAANGSCFLQGGSTTQVQIIQEFYLGGQGTSSQPVLMVVARDSTVAVTAITLGTNGKSAPLSLGSVAGTAPIPGFSASTMPQRAATLHLLQLAFNHFGGIVRWVAAPGEEIQQVGLAPNTGEVSLSAFTGTTGTLGSHIIYEVL